MESYSTNEAASLKLLIIAPYQVFPANAGGRIRVFELAKGLAEQGLQVTVVSPMAPGHIFPISINKNLTLKAIPYPFILPLLLTEKPFPYMYLMSFHPAFQVFFKELFQSHDIIQFECVSFANLTHYIPTDKKIIYDAQNVEYDYAASEAKSQWVKKIVIKRMFDLEKKLTRMASQVLTCSTRDANRLVELYGIKLEKCQLVPNGIDPHKQTPRLSSSEINEVFPNLMSFPQRVIFSGSDVVHNQVAVAFIINSLAPFLRQECAFIIKGQCGKSFKSLQQDNLFFDAQPDNVGPYADICTAALHTITQGSGTNLKVLDYLAHGLPIISTKFGMRGFDDLIPYVSLAEQPEEFLEQLRRKQPFSPNIPSILERYSWQAISQDLQHNYKHLSS
ncbi:MAG: glycosyltransferase [Methyloprofundus sp.]|nr:glycosyltransferase [Methyloprofundus sp.]